MVALETSLRGAGQVTGHAEIYLDHAASTPLRESARRAWLAAACEHHANPTGSHRAARNARKALDGAREAVAQALGAHPSEVVFTSGGSEADNMAITGALAARNSDTDATWVAVTTAAEHHAVLDPVTASGHGAVVGVRPHGFVDCEQLEDTLGRCDRVAVVSVIAVNNETGAITPMAEVAEIVRRLAPDALLHTDAVQAPNWIDVAELTADCDLVSVTGHKVGSPVGTGALVVRNEAQLDPLIVGGGQERGRRAGTPDVAGAVAFAAALSETTAERAQSVARIGALRDRLIDGLVAELGDRVLISAAQGAADRGHIAAGIANVCISGVISEALLFLIDDAGVAASAASSCSSGAQDPSHVLAAMGIPRELAAGSLRLSLGHTTEEPHIERAVDVIVASVRRLDRFGGG